jgi:hypothetical protein
LAPRHTGALNFEHLRKTEDIKNLEKNLYIGNDVYFQVCKVLIQNTVYSSLHKKDKIIDLDV